MSKQFFPLLGLLGLFACGDKDDNINLQQRMAKSDSASAKATQVFFAQPQQIDSSGIIMYPLILEKESSEDVSFSKGYSRRISYWNVIFYNTSKNTRQLLVKDKKIVIHSVDIESESYNSSYSSLQKDGIETAGKNIFYSAITKDFNGNALLDDDDPTYLFVSDREGNGFRQLSPDDYHVFSWNVVRGTNKVILQAARDLNGDKKLTDDDAVEHLIVDLSSGGLAVPSFGPAYMDSLKAAFTTTWQANNP